MAQNNIKSMYVTIRVDYESDNRMNDVQEKEYAANMVVDRANYSHTIDEGVCITNIEMCGYKEVTL